jgi:hypothetical protein
LGRVEGLTVYQGASGHQVACRGEGTGGLSLAADAALCLQAFETLATCHNTESGWEKSIPSL